MIQANTGHLTILEVKKIVGGDTDNGEEVVQNSFSAVVGIPTDDFHKNCQITQIHNASEEVLYSTVVGANTQVINIQ